MHRPTSVVRIVEANERPARGTVPRCPNHRRIDSYEERLRARERSERGQREPPNIAINVVVILHPTSLIGLSEGTFDTSITG